jgi:hypothetical protein
MIDGVGALEDAVLAAIAAAPAALLLEQRRGVYDRLKHNSDDGMGAMGGGYEEEIALDEVPAGNMALVPAGELPGSSDRSSSNTDCGSDWSQQ